MNYCFHNRGNEIEFLCFLGQIQLQFKVYANLSTNYQTKDVAINQNGGFYGDKYSVDKHYSVTRK